MPKSPIIERDLCFEKLGDGTIELLDFCPVQVEGFGVMVEPRQLNMSNGTNHLQNIDVFDASYTRIREFPKDKFVSEYNTGGRQLPKDYSPQGA
jgi:hypothetical protein